MVSGLIKYYTVKVKVYIRCTLPPRHSCGIFECSVVHLPQLKIFETFDFLTVKCCESGIHINDHKLRLFPDKICCGDFYSFHYSVVVVDSLLIGSLDCT